MTYIPPTISDISRSVTELNEKAKSMHDRDATNLVANNLAYQFAKNARHNGWRGHNVTTRDIRVALIVHGATPMVAEQYARVIARRIRADFSDGKSCS